MDDVVEEGAVEFRDGVVDRAGIRVDEGRAQRERVGLILKHANVRIENKRSRHDCSPKRSLLTHLIRRRTA